MIDRNKLNALAAQRGVSEARQAAEWLKGFAGGDCVLDLPIIGMPGGNTVSNTDYGVSYYDDKSILIWARGEGLIVLDDSDRYSRHECSIDRSTVEHLARCLGRFSKEKRAAMVAKHFAIPSPPAYVWIDGICWGADGAFLGL